MVLLAASKLLRMTGKITKITITTYRHRTHSFSGARDISSSLWNKWADLNGNLGMVMKPLHLSSLRHDWVWDEEEEGGGGRDKGETTHQEFAVSYDWKIKNAKIELLKARHVSTRSCTYSNNFQIGLITIEQEPTILLKEPLEDAKMRTKWGFKACSKCTSQN